MLLLNYQKVKPKIGKLYKTFLGEMKTTCLEKFQSCCVFVETKYNCSNFFLYIESIFLLKSICSILH